MLKSPSWRRPSAPVCWMLLFMALLLRSPVEGVDCNGSGSVNKIYGDQGTINLTNWRAPTFSRAGASNSAA